MSSALVIPQVASASDWQNYNRVHWDGSAADQTFSSLHHPVRGNSSSSFQGGLPTPPGSRAMVDITLNKPRENDLSSHKYQPAPYPHQDAQNPTSSFHSHSRSDSSANMQSHRSKSAMGHRTRNSVDLSQELDEPMGDSIAHYLRIPRFVNESGGSLAEFAAEITCLFWFETAATLQYAEDLSDPMYVDRGLLPDATPSIGFRKWVTTILSTTQVGKNVIILALLFIYRLKKFNPGVSGKRGSEFRLLTIALMLGNKFLDDNTYTNKTWAEVSGISVQEIHIMEVEFLSNMRYDLYVSTAEWATWGRKLGNFGRFYEHASKFSLVNESRGPGAPLTPVSQNFPQKFPSPPSTHHSTQYPTPHSATTFWPALPNPMTNVPHLPRSPVRHHRNPVLEQLERKRSMDFAAEMPPAKRMYQQPTISSSMSQLPTPMQSLQTRDSSPAYSPASSGSAPTFSDDGQIQPRGPRLPMPRIQTSNHAQLAPMAFPVSRAMSSVFPNPSGSWSQPVTPISAVPGNMSNPPLLNMYQSPIPELGDGSASRSHSNYGSAQVSPSAASYGVITPTRQGLSPSFFLTHRSSPYRPVRGVNTLLIPPPSASMQNPGRNVAYDQMQYHPLSKATTEKRTGPVPYLPHAQWQQSNASTPSNALQYPYHQ